MYQTIPLPAVTTYPGYAPGGQQPSGPPKGTTVGPVPTYYQGVAPKKGGVDAAVVAAAGVVLGAAMML